MSSHTGPLDRNPAIHKNKEEDFPSSSHRSLAFHIQFLDDDRKANFYEPGVPIHKSYIHTSYPWNTGNNSPTINNKAWVDIENTDGRQDRFAIGMPFHAKHFQDLTVDWHDAPVCQTSYLSLAMSEDTHPRGGGDHPNVFIMQTEEPAIIHDCDHNVDLDAGRSQRVWKALALLAGWRQVRLDLHHQHKGYKLSLNNRVLVHWARS